MIKFVVYQTKINTGKLTFEFFDVFDTYDEAMLIVNKDPTTLVAMPFEEDEDPLYWEE